MPVKSSEHWYADCARAMVREGVSLYNWANMNDYGLTQREAENVLRTQAFQETFRTQRNLYYKELANDPTLTKTAVEGMAILAITRLMEKGMDDKALNGIIQLAKLKGWTSETANVFNFGDLSQKEITALRAKFPVVSKVSKEN